MASKKKTDTDEVKKAIIREATQVSSGYTPIDWKAEKAIIREATQVVREGIESSLGRMLQEMSLPSTSPIGLNPTAEAIDALDKEFDVWGNKETFVDVLKNKFRTGDVDVRVMQVNPDGSLADVSDKINFQNLRPENFEGIKIDNGKMVPIGGNPQSRETAFRLLQELLPSMKLSQPQGNSTTESIKKMELALAESDEILNHWKK